MSRRLAAPILVIALLAPGALADGWTDAKKLFGETVGPSNHVTERQKAVRSLQDFDTRDAAKLLLEAIEASEKEEQPLQAESAEIAEEIERIVGGKMFDETRTLPGQLDRYNVLKAKLALLGNRIQDELKIRSEIEDTLSMYEAADTVKYLHTIGLKSRSDRTRFVVAVALGNIGQEQAIGSLRKVVGDRDLGVREAAIRSLGQLRAKEALPDLLKALEDKHWAVRAAAIRALGRLAMKEAVGPLIRRLGEEEGRLVDDIAGTLSELTGQRLGDHVEGWLAWWEKHRVEYEGEEGLALGGFRRDGGAGGVNYYGITTRSKSIIYVIDVSGSMSKAHDDPSKDVAGGELSKVDSAKRELIRSLKTLESDGVFTIVIYNDIVKVWKPQVVPASPAHKAEAETFVNGLGAASSTNIYGALEQAFKIAEGGRDIRYGGADTIFLLSDGSPTKPDGTLDSTEKIILAVREWNAGGRVVLHTIGIGKAHNRGFMQVLAAENGGQYVAR